MFLSLNALGFLVGLSFSRCGGSLARVYSHEEIAREARNDLEGADLAIRIYDAHAVGDYVICVLACNRKGIDGQRFWTGTRRVCRSASRVRGGWTCIRSVALGKLAPGGPCGRSRCGAHAFDCKAYSSTERWGVASLLRLSGDCWNLRRVSLSRLRVRGTNPRRGAALVWIPRDLNLVWTRASLSRSRGCFGNNDSGIDVRGRPACFRKPDTSDCVA